MYRFAIVISTLAAIATSSAFAFEPPKRKSGLWEMEIQGSQAKAAHKMQMCVDEKSDNLMQQQSAGAAKQNCSKTDIRKEGDKIVGDSVCTFGQSTATTHSVFTGKFDSGYRVDSKTTYDPPMMGMKEASTVIEAKWLGPCKPGQKGGDVIMPGMGTMNMNEMMKKHMQKNMPQQ